MGLTLSLPAGLHGSRVLSSLLFLYLQPDVSVPPPSQQTLLAGQRESFPCSPGGRFIHFHRNKTRGLVPKGPGSGSCFCCLTLLPVSDLVTAVHLLRQLLTALPHWPRSPGRETGDVSGKSRGTRDGGRVWRRLRSLVVLRVLPCSGRGADEACTPISIPHSLRVCP